MKALDVSKSMTSISSGKIGSLSVFVTSKTLLSASVVQDSGEISFDTTEAGKYVSTSALLETLLAGRIESRCT